jgi:tryptophan-rich sensory protein
LLLLFIGGVIGIGLLVGLVAEPGDYLTSLAVPDVVLPGWANTLVWLLLCVAFAVAGWRLWMLDPSSTETRLWLAIQILSWWFYPAFFLIRSPGLALVVITLLAAMMLNFIMRCWSRDRVSALLFIPCFLWVSYAAALTAAIVLMN